MLNVVAIMGRLARDPEMRQTTTGKNVASFRIACDRGRRDANGQSVADWIDVVVSGEIDQVAVTRVNDNGFCDGDIMGVPWLMLKGSFCMKYSKLILLSLSRATK